MEPESPVAESLVNYLMDGRGRKPKLDWSKVDWSKTNIELAKETGLVPDSFKPWRRLLAPETVKPTHHQNKIDWNKVDWSKTNREIANELGVAKPTVTVRRHKYAPDTVVPPAPLTNVAWASIDWYGLGTKAIADMYGVNTGLVSRYRKSYAPTTVQPQRKRYNWANVDWNKSNVEIATELGMNFPKETAGFVNDMRRLWAPRTFQPVKRIDWDSADWTKPTNQIANELGVDPSSVRDRKTANLSDTESVAESVVAHLLEG